jgi:uncharacterized protein YprB with RNaseH-like and TPR domain
LAISSSLRLDGGLILVSMLFPPSMEEKLLKILNLLLSSGLEGSIVTYNGNRFDLPYTINRGSIYGLNLKDALASYRHLDVYEIARDAVFGLQCYGQKAVEAFLGLKRAVDDISRTNYHLAYRSFLEGGDIGPILYNIEDSVGCIRILNQLTTQNLKR